jgi:trk system potassium uptake protein TrkH
MALPLIGPGVSAGEALFEAISGITTTGLSIIPHTLSQSDTLVFTTAWLQWLGGVAIIVLSFALLTGQRASARRLTEVLGQPQGIWGGTRAYAWIVIRIYLALTLIGMLALWLTGSGGFNAVTLTFAAVSTGSFSPFAGSLGGVGGKVQLLVMVLCIASAGPLPLYHQLWRGKWSALAADPEIRALLLAGLIVAALLWVASRMHGIHESPGKLLLTAFSAQTTAGFSAFPVKQLDAFSKVVLIAAMASGAAVGSSGGGMKLLRLIVLLRVVQLLILRTRLPERAALATRIAGRTWEDDELVRALIVPALFLAVVLLSWLAFVWAGYDPLDALFEVTSATATAGLSSGITGAALAPSLKAVLCADMLLGRLEILPFLVLLAPRTWIGHRTEVESSKPREELADHASHVSGRNGARGEDGARPH